MIFAYDILGVLTSHRVPSGRTITGKYYLKNTYDQRSERQLNAIILHDNTTAHNITGVTSHFTSYGWEVLDHPPYSPDICPCDYDLFSRLKENIRGVCYDTDELEVAVAEQVRVHERGCLVTGIEDLPNRWNLVLGHKGHYFEGS